MGKPVRRIFRELARLNVRSPVHVDGHDVVDVKRAVPMRASEGENLPMKRVGADACFIVLLPCPKCAGQKGKVEACDYCANGRVEEEVWAISSDGGKSWTPYKRSYDDRR